MFGEYIILQVYMSRGIFSISPQHQSYSLARSTSSTRKGDGAGYRLRGSFLPNNEERIGKPGDRFHRQEICKFAGPEKWVIFPISFSKGCITYEMYRFGGMPSGVPRKARQFA